MRCLQIVQENMSLGSLALAAEQVSRDGTRKRAYALGDGQLIESVLMPYADGRRTACISRCDGFNEYQMRYGVFMG